MAKDQIYKLQSCPTPGEKTFSLVRTVKIDQNYRQIDHVHSHDYFQVIFIDEGSAEHTIEYEKPVIMGPRSVSVVFPKQLHQISFSRDTRGIVLMFDEVLFCSDILKNQLKSYNRNLAGKLNTIQPQQTDYGRIRKMLDDMIRLLDQITPIRKEMIRFYIKILLLQLVEDVHEEVQPHKQLPSVNIYTRYKELIDAQYTKHQTVKDYAAQLGVSSKKLNQVCKTEIKTTALAVIHERILVEAKRLLLFSGESMKEIGFTLGFASPSAFNRFIYSRTGLTPLELKNSLS